MKGFLLGLLALRRLVALAGILCLSLIVYFGPALFLPGWAPMLSQSTRLTIAICLPLLWLVWYVAIYWRARIANARILRGLGIAAPDLQADIGFQDPLAHLREQFEKAVEAFSRDGRGGLEAIPWYVVLGPPGSGKTTMLRASGMRFVVADDSKPHEATCGLFVTEQALFLDTAGQFTLPDGAGGDTAWTAVLDLLRTHRPRQPLNGVILAVSAASLLEDEASLRGDLLESVRHRLLEVRQHLGIDLPIYLVLTQCDLVPGFVEAHDDLNEEGAAQFLGVVVPPGEEPDVALRSLRTGFEAMLRVSERRVAERLHEERDPARRALNFVYPEQLAVLLQRISSLAEQLFRASRLQVVPQLRAAVLTCAAPSLRMINASNTDVDRFLGTMPGLAVRPAVARPRPLFLREFLDSVVPGDAALAGLNPRLERRLAAIHYGGYAALAAAVVLMISVWWSSSIATKRHLTINDHDLDALKGAVAELRDTSRLESVHRVLDVAGRAAGRTRNTFTELLNDLGLIGPHDADVAADDAYERLLHGLFLPALVGELEDDLTAAVARQDPTVIRPLLAAYLMANMPDRYNPQVFGTWVEGFLQRRYVNEPNVLAAFRGHWRALAQAMPLSVAVDSTVVASARTAITRRPQAERIYDQIRRAALTDTRLPRLELGEVLQQPGAEMIFMRTQAGLPVTVPSFYTRDGFYNQFLVQLPQLAFQRDADEWITGGLTGGNDAALKDLVNRVTDLYVRDYVQAWQAVLNQVGLRAPADLPGALALLEAFAGPTSPLTRLIEELRLHTDLPVPGGATTQAAGGAAAAAAEAVATTSPLARLAAMLGATASQTPAPGRPQWPGDRIRAPFASLVALLDTRSGQAPIARVQDGAATAFGALTAIATSPNPAQAAHQAAARRLSGQSTDALSSLTALSATLPNPASRLVNDLASRSWSQVLALALAHVNIAWGRDVAPVCERAIAQRFPIVAGAESDIPLQDFRAFFGNGGIIPKFVDEMLQPFVTLQGRNFTPASAGGVSVPLSRDGLEALSRAKAIQDMFFGPEGNMQFRFAVTPRFLDAGATRAVLEVDQTRVVYQHDPPRTTEFTWPSQGDAGVVQVSITGIDGTVRVSRMTGAWALFRALEQNAPANTGGPEAFRLSFQVDGLSASFALRTSRVQNPVNSPEVRGFRCVSRL